MYIVYLLPSSLIIDSSYIAVVLIIIIGVIFANYYYYNQTNQRNKTYSKYMRSWTFSFFLFSYSTVIGYICSMSSSAVVFTVFFFFFFFFFGFMDSDLILIFNLNQRLIWIGKVGMAPNVWHYCRLSTITDDLY